MCIGVFSDIVNLIFRDESSHEVTSDSLEASDNFRQNGKMKQREDILAKCFQFLKLLARYASEYIMHEEYKWYLIGTI